MLKFFLSFVVNVIFQTAVIFSSSPLVYSLFSHVSALWLAVRVPVRSIVCSSVLSLVVRQSWIRSSVCLFVRSFVRRSSVAHQSWIRSFVSSFLRLFVVRQSWVRSSVCLFVRSLVRSIARLSSESVGLSFCYPVSQPARQVVIRSVSKSVCQFFIFSLIHSIYWI